MSDIPRTAARARYRRLRDLSRSAAKAVPGGQRVLDGAAHALLAVAAALIAFLPTHALGLREGFWAAITAVAVVQTELDALRGTARDQMLGAMIGGVAGFAVASLLGHAIGAYALAVAIAIVTAYAANVATAARLSAITATIILLVPHGGSDGAIMVARLSEVAWGVGVGLGVAWPIAEWERRREARRTAARRATAQRA